MTIQYRSIQLLLDHPLHPATTVAVIAHDGESAYFRAIGVAMNSDDVDLAQYRSIPGVPPEADWVYEEWMGWFNDLITHYGHDATRIFKELDVLQEQSQSFVVNKSGSIAHTEGRSTAECVEEIFQKFVQEQATPSASPFSHTLTITDDADVSRTVKFSITQTAYGVAVDLLNADGKPISGAKLDFFDNTLRVIAHTPDTFDSGDPEVNEILIPKVIPC